MCELTKHITISFGETDTEYFGRINNDGCITTHNVSINDVPNENDAMMIFLANALGYEPACLLNLDVFATDEEDFK